MQLSAAADPEFKQEYGRLIYKAERIFRTEEQWMEEIAFPELKHHRAQHASILGTLYRGQSKILAGNNQAGRHILDHDLPEWLLLHAFTMDVALADELRVATHVA